MKIGVHKGTKVTEPDFSEIFLFGPNWEKRAQNAPKNGLFQKFLKIESFVFVMVTILTKIV